MRKSVVLFFGISLGIMLLPVHTQAQIERSPALEPGEISIQSSLTRPDRLKLDIEFKQAPKEQYKVLAVKIYSEPSHTLLVSLVDPKASKKVTGIARETAPFATLTADLTHFAPVIEIQAPPVADNRIRVDYVIKETGQIRTMPVCDLTIQKANASSPWSDVGFSVVPAGGGFKICLSCGETKCNCVYCSSIRAYICCPCCQVTCEPVVCPPGCS